MSGASAVTSELSSLADELERNAGLVDAGDMLGDARRQRLLAGTLRGMASDAQ